MPDFLAWQRPAVYALSTAAPVGARLDASLPITLHDDLGDVSATASFLLAGPGDVERPQAGQVVSRRPHPGCIDAETTMMPFVELDAADLPWRFSPVPYVAGAPAVRPWLVTERSRGVGPLVMWSSRSTARRGSGLTCSTLPHGALFHRWL